MWGAACYFAVKASYSHNYTHVDNNTCQLFLAEVLIGDCATRPSGRYETPPMKEDGTNNEYDSIKGFTNGSDVYMVYSNNKSYPRYLISYK